MKVFNNINIIGVDHGFGNMKTTNFCFPSNVIENDGDPLFDSNVLEYNGRSYTIGDGHMEYNHSKVTNENYYILTLAAVAMEMDDAGQHVGKVFLGAGVPLSWLGNQKEEFRQYLTHEHKVHFTWNHESYDIEIVGAALFPQGVAAIMNEMSDYHGTHVMCDIGNGTMNIMFSHNGQPSLKECYTDMFGVHQCMIKCREALTQKFGDSLPDSVIDEVLRNKSADIGQEYIDVVTTVAEAYVKEIQRHLREYHYHEATMHLDVLGGGACLFENFGEYDKSRVHIIKSICETARGYERLAASLLESGRVVIA